ncbi:hypothetical protein [Methanosarcina acetivorans]|uniref:GNAT family N-acetyltransferase n=1 Tax=Methanosarcina acetivorans (strain ATCC 35395 / DSM 2834 / JCM 12185 / C2A) TaxID=188937 RepID=Q8THR1_METAC|nr:hypothetical protein [Methanosarcina acetivorans]AAM07792.1 predicted protein [Methanosarcina acetivorans C2A]
MSEIEVRELLPSESKDWDLLVEKAQPGMIFHASDWLGICRDTLSRDFKIYGCSINGELVGGCPFFIKNFKGMLKIGSSTCKMTGYCGPLYKRRLQL